MKLKSLFLLLTLAVYYINTTAQNEVLVSTDYPPYNFVNEKGELEGFNIDILKAIGKLYNVQINIKGADWNTANELLQEGKTQAIAGAHYSGIPDEEYNYTRSVIRTQHCFLYNKNFRNKISADIIRTEPDPLIVLWKNDILIHYLKSINPKTRFVFVDNYEELLKQLDRKEITCAFSQKISSMYHAVEMHKTYIGAGNEEVLERNMGFKISKNAPDLTRMLNDGLEIIISNGEYQKIYNNWIEPYNTDNKSLAVFFRYAIMAGIFAAILLAVLVIFNYLLQSRVKKRTRDLQHQLELNTQITTELEAQKIKAEESDKMKSAFLANMSHEIRTPMNGILGFAELLKSNDFPPEKQKQYIDIIHQSGERMLTTINNIIEISKIESGAESVNISETNIEKNIWELFHFFELEAKKKGINLVIEKKEVSLKIAFFSDSYKLNSIITNLIKNAIKFTPEGFVKIGFSISDEKFEFYVSDTGIGIEEEKQKLVFNHFVQADTSTSSRFEGSGLGLSICREYTRMLQGEIGVESEIGVGSTFYVTIPNQNKQEAPVTLTTDKKESKKPSIPPGLKMIVAEDDKTSFLYLKFILEEISAEILHATTGLEAIKLAENHPDADIILMDSKMPEMDGMEAVKHIRRFNSKVFIIAQTAYAQEDYNDTTIDAGCNGYIEKPVDKQKLMKLISKGISKN